jgi:serine/threonine protein kinase
MLLSGAVNNRGYYLSFQTRLKMAYECCLSVAHLHSRGLMHCDIKSLNFLVTSDLCIRLADLGEARVYAGLRHSEVQGLPRYARIC